MCVKLNTFFFFCIIIWIIRKNLYLNIFCVGGESQTVLIPSDHGPSQLTYWFSFSSGDIFLDVQFAIDSTEITDRCSLIFFRALCSVIITKEIVAKNLIPTAKIQNSITSSRFLEIQIELSVKERSWKEWKILFKDNSFEKKKKV